jgi:hypothetical protein
MERTALISPLEASSVRRDLHQRGAGQFSPAAGQRCSDVELARDVGITKNLAADLVRQYRVVEVLRLLLQVLDLVRDAVRISCDAATGARGLARRLRRLAIALG